jgi:glyoxylase-like metal-dependent hydrolase (beta-lactamase superfamily II)
MKRTVIFGVLLVVCSLSLAVGTAQQSEQVVEVDQLRDNLYILRGGGGNSAAFVTSDGVVLVDTKLAGWGQPLLDKIGELTSNPVTTIINTHTHFDHVSGNVDFPATVSVVAHENTEQLMGEWNPVTGLGREPPNVFDTSGGQGMPTQTFTDSLTLGSGADQVDLYYFGRAHTGGDAWVVFPSLRVMHAGDAFPGKQVPIMDANNGGSGVDYPGTLWNAYAGVPEIDTIITGHSTPMMRDDLREYATFVGAFVSAARSAKRDGFSAEEFARVWQVPPRFMGYRKPAPERLQAYVQVVFDEIEE